MTEGFGENFVDELGVNSPVYTGTSITGDFGEALRIAIAEAKRQLHSSLVRWQLASLAGVNGGFVGQNDLTVVIHATPDSGRDADSAGPPRLLAVGPDKRYSYKFDYGFFLVRPGSGGGYMLGVEPPGPTTAANPSYFTSCRLTYKQELKIKNNTLPGWVYEATQFRENGRVNNPNPYRYFFIASQDNGNGKFYIGFSDTPGDPIKFENNTYKDETAQTAIDG